MAIPLLLSVCGVGGVTRGTAAVSDRLPRGTAQKLGPYDLHSQAGVRLKCPVAKYSGSLRQDMAALPENICGWHSQIPNTY